MNAGHNRVETDFFHILERINNSLRVSGHTNSGIKRTSQQPQHQHLRETERAREALLKKQERGEGRRGFKDQKTDVNRFANSSRND